MKNFMFAVLMLLFVGTAFSISYSCTDSDVSNDASVKGMVIQYEGSTTKFSWSDSCINSYIVSEKYCSSDGVAKSKNVTCDSGYTCFAGKCITQADRDSLTCTETDSGNDYFNQGTAYGTHYVSGVTGEFKDSCTVVTAGVETTASRYIKEFFCGDGVVYMYYDECASGYTCLNGECVSEVEEPEPVVYTCKETDDGYDLYEKGTSDRYIDSRLVSSGTDYCESDGKVHEYWCVSNDSLATGFSYDCPSGYKCSDGACVRSTSDRKTCAESDGGNNKYVKGTNKIYYPDGSLSTSNFDYCTDRNTVVELTCAGEGWDVTYETCPSGYACSDGACVRTSSIEKCADSDGKDGIYNRGTVKYVNFAGVEFSADDACIGTSMVREYYCPDEHSAYTSWNAYCPADYVCSDGACVKKPEATASRITAYVLDKNGNRESSGIKVYLYYSEDFEGNGIVSGYTDRTGAAYLDVQSNHIFYLDGYNSETGEVYGGKDGSSTSGKYRVKKADSSYVLCNMDNSCVYDLTIMLYARGYGESNGSDSGSNESIPELPEETEHYTIELKKGWNLVSAPVKMQDQISSTAEVAATSCESPKLFVYDPLTNRYVSEGYGLDIGDSVPVPNAFWVKATSPCKISFQGAYKQSYESTWSPRTGSGWVAIGGPYDRVRWQDVVGDCEVLSGPWSFDTAAWKWKKSTALEPGVGYFVKLGGTCTLGADIPPFPSD